MNYYDPNTWQTILVRLIAAILCGAAVGWERESHRKPAGLRTNMLVALGAAVFTILSLRLAGEDRTLGVGGAHLDPLRAIQGIIGGIGFLGAGAIIRSAGSVHGMTTAATLWVVGAAGIACGMAMYELAIIGTMLCFFVLTVPKLIEHHEKRKEQGDDEAK